MSSAPGLSVVIPTRDRREILSVTLTALDEQRCLSERFEVVVVDDGSVDATSTWLAAQSFASFELTRLATDGRGPAAARNLGIRSAAGRRVLLLGDDTIPNQETVAAHLNATQGLQGPIEWDASQTVTEVMRFLAPEGPQFWFKGLEEGDLVAFTSVYAANLSAPRQWFLKEPFDEGFPNACFEDTEMAWRWVLRGWRVRFSQRPRCRHRHSYDRLEPILRRQRQAGAATRRLVRRHPRLLWRMLVVPVLVGARELVFHSVGPWRRPGERAKWDRQCRAAWLSGLLRG